MGSTIFSGDKVATLKDKLAVGKDTTAPQIINSTTNPTTSAVSAPLGSLLINRSTGEYYKKLDAGSSTNWELLGSGGAGGINYIKNPDFEVGTADTSVSDADVSIAVQTTNKLRGTQSLEITWTTATDIGDYVGMSMSDLDPQDVGKNLWVSFDYSENGNMAVDEFEVVLYNTDNSTEEVVVGEFLPTGALTTRSRFVGRVSAFETVANSAYELRIRSLVSRGALSQSIMHIDNVRVAPDALVPGAIVTDWQDFTLTVGSTGTAPSKPSNPIADTAHWRRVGDSMEIEWLYRNAASPSGGSAGTGTYTFDLPSGYLIDTSKIEVTNSGGITTVGSATVYSGTGSDNATGTVTVADSNSLYLCIGNNAAGDQVVTAASYPLNGASIFYSFRAVVPIQGWSSGASLSTTEANLQTVQAIAYDNASGANTAFASGATEIITYDNVVVDTHNSITTGASWKFTAPRKANYAIDANIIWSTNANLTQTLLYVYKNGSLAAWLDAGYTNNHIQGSTVIPLEKGDYIDVRAAPTTSDVSVRNPDGSTTSSRVSITSLPDFSTFSVYGETEVLSAQSGSKTPSATNHYHALTGNSVTLTPGTWVIWGHSQFGNGGTSPGYTSHAAGIFGANGADSSSPPSEFQSLSGVTELSVAAGSALTVYHDTTAGVSNFSCPVGARIFQLTETQTAYLVSYSLMATPANARIRTSIIAQRIK